MAIVTNHKRGFTIFFAMLVSSLALAVGLAIYDLTVRELDLSATATQSQYAIYAADTGAECALYWDFKCTQENCTTRGANNSAFATSTTSVVPSSGVYCGKNADASPQDIAVSWQVQRTATAATTTFTLNFAPERYCAQVVVSKSGSPSVTTVTSHGYNSCTAGVQNLLERVLQVTY